MSSRWRRHRSSLSLSLGTYTHADGSSDIDKAISSSLGLIEREVGLTTALVRALQAELNEQKAARAEGQAELAAANVKVKELAKEARELRGENARLQAEVVAVRVDLRKEKTERKRLEGEREVRVEKQKVETAKLKETEGELVMVKVANAKLRSKVRELEADKSTVAEQLERVQSELTQFEARRRGLRVAALEVLKAVEPAHTGPGALLPVCSTCEEINRGSASQQLVLPTPERPVEVRPVGSLHLNPYSPETDEEEEEPGVGDAEPAPQPDVEVVVKEETGAGSTGSPPPTLPPAEPRKKRARLQTRGQSSSLDQRRSSDVQPSKLRRLSTRGSSVRSTVRGVVDVDSVQDLYDTEPWEDMFDKRATVSRTFDFNALKKRAKDWVLDVLRFQSKHRQALWEREHWLSLPCNSPDVGIASVGRKRHQRQAVARKTWQRLETRATNLIRAGMISEDVRSDPWLWTWAKSPVLWAPASRNLVKELETEDAAAPDRNFFVDDKLHHAFFANKLRRKYPAKFPLPEDA